MIECSEVKVEGFEAAIRGMRNSWNSHSKSDSKKEWNENNKSYDFIVGEEDLKLMKKLIRAGSDHAKFMRQINVSLDINSALYWWKQFDTYKVGTTANSESTMHTINRTGFFGEREMNKEMFSFNYDFIDELEKTEIGLTKAYNKYINLLEDLRVLYNDTKDKRYWDLLIALLPSGFNQKRTVTLNYAVLSSIYHSRKSHKLKEWHEFCDWIETLPYSELITGKEGNK